MVFQMADTNSETAKTTTSTTTIAPVTINDIYNTFIDYYGENRVDLVQSADEVLWFYNTYAISMYTKYIILVHWPNVKITNEHDKSIEIKDFFCLIQINKEFKLQEDIRFNKSTYSEDQWRSQYIHSHVQSLNYPAFNRFKPCCLGSGPIKTTSYRLKNEKFDEFTWRSFVWELDKYVHVESLVGVPYMYLERVGTGEGYSRSAEITANFWDIAMLHPYKSAKYVENFFTHLASSGIFKFHYIDGQYRLAEDPIKLAINITNVYIKWANEDTDYPSSTHREFMKYNISDYYLIGNKLYTPGNSSTVISSLSYIGRDMFKFKGNMIKLKLDTTLVDHPTMFKVLRLDIIGHILYKVERFVNVCYGSNVTIDKKLAII
jgi:hypothetical protein